MHRSKDTWADMLLQLTPIDYARRVVWYAFGPAGDIDIAAFQPTPEKIMVFHQEAERLEAARQASLETPPETPRMRIR